MRLGKSLSIWQLKRDRGQRRRSVEPGGKVGGKKNYGEKKIIERGNKKMSNGKETQTPGKKTILCSNRLREAK